MNFNERKDIKLKYKDADYDAHFEFDSKETARTRLFWKSDFKDVLAREFKEYYDVLVNDLDFGDAELPKIRLEKIDQYNFSIELIVPNEIEEDFDSEEAENNLEYSEIRPEGNVKYIYGKKYERDPVNRANAIKYHGTICKICGFDFEEVYGQRGKGYIEIHHIKPLSFIGEEVKINPITDLIPVCANCHRMIHRRKNDILDLEEMKDIIDKYTFSEDD
ncbi:HNH endonuclease [Alkalibacter rhizosphaerae]|uniref:HNH endonuclease n=2 Tax=Alkalibacter rhizosphaerae TaxID=2815577 RepID=A0A974XJ57_9FIRM|nr:HNH endonuclease [Alkalibacter rhizosphaerae]